MKKMNYAEPIIDAYNAIAGTVIAVLSYILGDHWILFLAFLLLNVADWLTGWMKSRIAGKENSAKGWQGVLKKLGRIRSKRNLYRDRSCNWCRLADHDIAWLVCTGKPINQ